MVVVRFQDRPIELADAIDLRRQGLAAGRQVLQEGNHLRPELRRPGRRFPGGPHGKIAARLCQHLAQLPRLDRPHARHQRQDPRRRHFVPRVLGQAQEGEQVLDVGRFHELQPAVLVEGNMPGRQFGLQAACCGARPETTRPAAARPRRPRDVRGSCGSTKSACSTSSSHVTCTGRCPSWRSDQRFFA